MSQIMAGFALNYFIQQRIKHMLEYIPFHTLVRITAQVTDKASCARIALEFIDEVLYNPELEPLMENYHPDTISQFIYEYLQEAIA